MYVCMYIRTYVRTYVCMYVWMYVCVCVWQSCAWKMVCVKVMCAFCWLSSVEENGTSLLLSVFLCSMGLARKQRASPGAQRKPTQSEVTPCLQICFACFGRFEILEFVQCWVLFVSGCFYVFLQFNFPLASDLTIGFASWWCFFCFFCFFWLLRHRTCHFFKGCEYVCMYVWGYVCMRVRMYEGTYVCM